MGLLGVPLTWYSGMRPSPIVWGPRSNLWCQFRLVILDANVTLPPITRKSGWSPADANLP
jgi:hypothetical protein